MSTLIAEGQPYEVRRVAKIGNSLMISLPYEWVWNHDITKGDFLIIEDDSQGRLMLTPFKERDKEGK